MLGASITCVEHIFTLDKLSEVIRLIHSLLYRFERLWADFYSGRDSLIFEQVLREVVPQIGVSPCSLN